MTEAWGDPAGGDDVPGESALGQRIDLGNGDYMVLNLELTKHELLHSEEAVEAVMARAQLICDDANGQVPGSDKLYTITLQNDMQYTRTRARVRPANLPDPNTGKMTPIRGIAHDAKYSTLLHAMANHPSDPIPTGEEAW
jgi:hypothetical protein